MSNNNDKELSEMLDDLSSRLNNIEKEIHNKKSQENTANLNHQANVDDDPVFSALEGESMETIENIKNVLNMIGEGRYGFCSACGIEIPEERMQALPYTNMCSGCDSH